jgi:hypothetical protein
MGTNGGSQKVIGITGKILRDVPSMFTPSKFERTH